MSDILHSKYIELSDEEIAGVECAELTPTARRILQQSNFPYANILLNGSPEEIQNIGVRFAMQYLGVPASLSPNAPTVHSPTAETNETNASAAQSE